MVALLLIAAEAQAADKDKEPTAIFEIGGAAERTFHRPSAGRPQRFPFGTAGSLPNGHRCAS
jgi:hypothetical protein